MDEHPEGGTRHGFVNYRDDGIDILTRPDGLPKAWREVPAPMMPEDDRRARFAQARRALWLEGWFIESERMIRNRVFDKRGEKTTLKLVTRVCKNHDEALQVLGHIREIIADHRDPLPGPGARDAGEGEG